MVGSFLPVSEEHLGMGDSSIQWFYLFRRISSDQRRLDRSKPSSIAS